MTRARALVIAAVVLTMAIGCHVGQVRIGGGSSGAVTLPASSAAIAFRQGIEAAQLGRALADCPYTDQAASRAWIAGWQWAHGK